MVDEFADGDRGGAASAETQEEKEEVEILSGRSAFVYMVVDRYADKVLAPVGVLLAGALIMVGAAVVTFPRLF